MATLFPSRAEPGERFVRVAVERGFDAGDATGDGLTYSSGDQPLEVGERVEVPLGRKNARAAGIVVRVGGADLLEGLDPERVKRVLRRTGAGLPPPLVELARWMSTYYVCPLGMVLSAMMPAAVKQAVGARTRMELEPAAGAESGAEGLTPSAREALDAIIALGADPFPMTPAALRDAIGAKTLAPINRLVRAGLLVEREVREVRSRGDALLDAAIPRAEPTSIEPTREQAAVIEGVAGTLGTFAVHLVRGVTGSGKTEVYLRVIDRVLAQGQTALVLVPEIALTPQTAARFRDRFASSGVALLHSGLPAGQRHRQWARAASGEARVVVGARSAVFAPLPRLGVVIVDEEHDGSGYKQDQLPRFHGRDVAIKRAQIERCPAVLGSATPSLESWANAIGPSPRYRLWTLEERVGGGRLPTVEVVDLMEERRARGAGPPRSPLDDVIGPRLEAAIARTLDDGGQVILLLNRRGFATYVACPSRACGWSLACDSCDAAMVVHVGRELPAGRVLRCHHCLAERLVPETCPVCARRVIALGTGTQRLEQAIEARFGPTHGLKLGDTLLRLDGDTMRTGHDYADALSGFASGRVRLILGTQVVAKGLDYPNVRLVGVVNADSALWVPDFRAAERTFQLVSQVAGRAGRGAHPGLVVVQTTCPEEAAIRHAAAHDYVGFARRELEIRRSVGLPPSMRMARIVVRDEDLARARDDAARIAARLAEIAGDRVRVAGPIPCALSRLAGQYRIAVEVVARRASEIQAPLAQLRAEGLVKSDAHTAVDVDPVSLL